MMWFITKPLITAILGNVINVTPPLSRDQGLSISSSLAPAMASRAAAQSCENRDGSARRRRRAVHRLFIEPIEILAHVAERGKASPPIQQRLQFQLRLDPALFAAGVGHRAPVRVVDKTAPRMIMR